jgi:hypothetical protein
VPSTSQGRPPLLFIAPQPYAITGHFLGATDATGTSVAPTASTCHHTPKLQWSNSPALDASDASWAHVYRLAPRFNTTDASDGRPTDVVLRLIQRKAARLLSAKPIDADVSVCRANARMSVAPLYKASCRAARVRRQTLHSRVCRVHRARLSRVSQRKFVPRLRHFFQPSAQKKFSISSPRKCLTPNPSLPLKLHRLHKCANTNK